MRKTILMIIIITIFSGCRFPISNIPLGDGYVLLREDQKNRMLLKSISKDESFSTVIPGNVIEYDYDESFIVIFREASKYSFNHLSNKALWEKCAGEYYQFWIVEKATGKKYGPLNLEKYLTKRKELTLSEKLKLLL
jgi:Protein of unknown function (DUF3997)